MTPKYKRYTTRHGTTAFLPDDVDEAELIEITKIGSVFAEFLDPRTGQRYDCEKIYDQYLEELMRK